MLTCSEVLFPTRRSSRRAPSSSTPSFAAADDEEDPSAMFVTLTRGCNKAAGDGTKPTLLSSSSSSTSLHTAAVPLPTSSPPQQQQQQQQQHFLCRVVWTAHSSSRTITLERTVEVDDATVKKYASSSLYAGQSSSPQRLDSCYCFTEAHHLFHSTLTVAGAVPSSSPGSTTPSSLPMTTRNSTRIRFSAAERIYDADIVVVEGPRPNSTIHSELHRALLGCFVVPTSIVRFSPSSSSSWLENGSTTTTGIAYRVVSTTLNGGHSGVARITPSTRIKINTVLRNKNGSSSGVGPSGAAKLTSPLFGLDSQMRLLQAFVMCSPPGAVMLLHGPRGCGRTSLLQQSGVVVLVEWNDSNAVALPLLPASTQPVLLVVRNRLNVFPTDDAHTAIANVAGYRQAVRHRAQSALSPLFLAVFDTTGSPLEIPGLPFDCSLSVSLPTVETRVALLQYYRDPLVRGRREPLLKEEKEEDGKAVQLAAARLVGKSCREVIAAANALSTWEGLDSTKLTVWSDIGGLEQVKAQLYQSMVLPRLHPERFLRFGLTPPRGILLYGPPGCAKTTLVKALCSEQLFSFVYLDSASVISAYVGESERYLRDVFRRARETSPCIVFFDEVENLGAKRQTGGAGDEKDRLLATLLTELDGFGDAQSVCFVGATNMPHLLDPALLRPGRLDQLISIPLPSDNDRIKIFAAALRDAWQEQDLPSDDRERLRKATEGYSGADIQSVCKMVLLEKAEGWSRRPGVEERSGDTLTAKGKEGDIAPNLSEASGSPPPSSSLCAADISPVTVEELLAVIAKHPRSTYDMTGIEQFEREVAHLK